jgi:hypothetical protein
MANFYKQWRGGQATGNLNLWDDFIPYSSDNIMEGTFPLTFNTRWIICSLQMYRGRINPRMIVPMIRSDLGTTSSFSYHTFVENRDRTDCGGAYYGIFLGY